MSLPEVRVKPSLEYTAEVVVLITTLGTKRTEFNAGQRARDLLEIKRAHHKIIDFNRDARAQTTAVQGKAIAQLSNEGSKYRRLHTDEDDDLILPQIFVDGLYIGDADELQGLEDDGLLDDLLRRKSVRAEKEREATAVRSAVRATSRAPSVVKVSKSFFRGTLQ